MPRQMLPRLDEQAQERGALRKIEPYYNDLYKQKMFFGRFSPAVPKSSS